ncbi:DUF2142 domain-containing protein [Ruminococcus sp. 5_1_39BFAA]|uniref:DUF2142 domain-containing protein n=1 Tax=Ruminococcus sp. 5_1_39BFAA TaxID=457412 RepID=UPI0035650B88
MKLLNRMRESDRYRRIVAFFIILILTALVEVVFNYHTIISGFDDMDLTDAIKLEEEGNHEKYVVDFVSDQGIYVKQIKLTGDFGSDNTYVVEANEINGFGKEETKYYWDNVSTWFRESYTNLNKKITALKITLYKTEKTTLESISLSNHFEVNKYRFIWVLFTLFFLYGAFFENKAIKKIEWYFVCFSLIFGMLIIIYAQPTYNAWDEEVHFKNVYSIASGKNVEWSEAALEIINRTVPVCNTKAEYAELRKAMDEKGQEYLYVERKETAVVPYSFLAYIPMAIFVKAGMILGLSFSQIYMIGKIGNLLFYILVMFWAIYLARQKKLFIVFIAMMPTSIYLAASYSYDAVVFGCVTLGCVLWCNEMFYSQKRYQTANIIGAIFLLSVGCLSKAVYIPLILLMLLLPQFMKMNKKQKTVFALGILAILGLIMMTFVLPVFSNTVAGNLSFGGDSRGGDTSVVRQIISMVKHPWTSIKLMVTNVLRFDNFRNLGDSASSNYFWGSLMFLNLGSLGILSHKWVALLIPVVVLLLLYREKPEEALHYQKGYKLIIGLIIAMTVFLIWLALYLSFTPVGDEAIAGVQARYYLPLIYLIALLISNRNVYIQARNTGVAKIVLATVNVFWIISIYSFFLQTRLI